jgi:hypothetical protein
MDLLKFEKLKEKYDNITFEKVWNLPSKISFYTSYLWNILLIVFGFIFIHKIINDIEQLFSFQTYLLSGLVLLILILIEYFKRETIIQLAKDSLSNGFFNNKNIFNIILSLSIISISFYLSVNGAKELVNNIEQEEKNTEVLIERTTVNFDSIKTKEITPILEKIENKEKTLNQFRSKEVLSSRDERILKEIQTEISKHKEDINSLELKYEKKSKDVISKLEQLKTKTVNKSKFNQNIFIYIGIILELLIIIKLIFFVYYEFKSYFDKKEELKNNNSYKEYLLHSELLRILYQNGTKVIGEDLSTEKQFKVLVSSQNIITTQKKLEEFLKLCNYLKITQIVSKKRKAVVTFTEGLNIIKKHLNLN